MLSPVLCRQAISLVKSPQLTSKATYLATCSFTTSTLKMSSNKDSGKVNFPGLTSKTPGEEFEVRQTKENEDYTPDPSKSLPLSPARQRLIDDIIALYSCEPTVERVKRYTPDCVYDDQFVYANDRYKMAGQWFALPKLFNGSKCEGYQIVTNDRDLIQFRNEQVCSISSPNPKIYARAG